MSDILLLCVLAVHAFVTLYMTGLIWFVQIVHYPLFSQVGKAEYRDYQHQHMRRTSWVVMAPMILELICAAVLVWSAGGALAWIGLALLAVVWLSTALSQVPMHHRLEAGFDQSAHGKLVAGNWLRTGAWSLRGLLATVMLASH